MLGGYRKAWQSCRARVDKQGCGRLEALGATLPGNLVARKPRRRDNSPKLSDGFGLRYSSVSSVDVFLRTM